MNTPCHGWDGLVHLRWLPSYGVQALTLCRSQYDETISATLRDFVTCVRCLTRDLQIHQGHIRELAAYNTPLAKIIEANSVKDLAEDIDQRITQALAVPSSVLHGGKP